MVLINLKMWYSKINPIPIVGITRRDWIRFMQKVEITDDSHKKQRNLKAFP